MSLGKSIRIYLKDGTVFGIKQAEVVNHTIQSLSSPRKKISDLNILFQRELNKPGVYFLIGEDRGNNSVYIGEAENVWERLKSHDTQKDFWNEVILFTSKDENLTKSHVKYLESRLISIAIDADRYKIKNSNSPNLSSLPLADKTPWRIL
ncbi:GIY-YIG nuclease family protein [Flavobacterium rhizosphaerae]|uniref:GIY-YIG nuclease family protein n=1 Tax=Flavobacterium rhizosphaerae TaxID=3163298 RepID=A0ABW8YW73_9FLAO